MIANIDNLISLWIMKEKINSIQYLEKIWIFKRVNWQLTQVESYSAELLEQSYNDYLSSPLCNDDIEKFWWEYLWWWYIFKTWDCIYFYKDLEINKRNVRRIKKYKNERHIRIGYYYHNIEFIYDTKA